MSVYKKYFKKDVELIFKDDEITDQLITEQQANLVQLLVDRKETETLIAQIANVLEYCEVNNILLQGKTANANPVNYFKGKYWQIVNKL